MECPTSDKRSAIINAALELIAEHGFHGAPAAKIAARAGVGAGTIYRYFSDKDTLIVEVHRELENRMMQLLHEGYPAQHPLRQRFLHVGRTLLRYLVANPIEFRFLEQYFNSPYGVALRRDMIFAETNGNGKCDLLRGLLAEGQQQGVVKDLPMVVLFALALGPFIALSRDSILGFIILDDHLIEQTVTACWDAIKKAQP